MLWTDCRSSRLGSRIADFVGEGPEDTRGRLSGSQSVSHNCPALCGDSSPRRRAREWAWLCAWNAIRGQWSVPGFSCVTKCYSSFELFLTTENCKKCSQLTGCTTTGGGGVLDLAAGLVC